QAEDGTDGGGKQQADVHDGSLWLGTLAGAGTSWRAPGPQGPFCLMRSLWDPGGRDSRDWAILLPRGAGPTHYLNQRALLADGPACRDQMKFGLPVAQGATTAPLPAGAEMREGDGC